MNTAIMLADFLCDNYLDGDPSEGLKEFEETHGAVSQEDKDEALSLYYSYASSEYAQQQNM